MFVQVLAQEACENKMREDTLRIQIEAYLLRSGR